MANFNNALTNNLIDNLLPTYGKPRVQLPVWDEGQKMFVGGEYESASGHRYYQGVRFSDRIAIVEKVGMYHNWTYIDEIELYAFNGTRLELVQKRTYEKSFRSESFVREQSVEMVADFIRAAAKISGSSMSDEQVKQQAVELVERSYKSFLDSDYNLRLSTQILPAIGMG